MTKTAQPIESVSKGLASRKAGRPKADQLQGDALKRHVIQSAAVAYAEWGYHGCSVEKIAKVAGISRPLFYRLFASKDDVLDKVVEEVNLDLFDSTKAATLSVSDPGDMLDAAIDAYFQWCEHHQPVARMIYRELNDPQSPACKQYQRTVEKLLDLHIQNFALAGLPAFKPELILTLTKTVEFAGSRLLEEDNKDPQSVDLYRMVARRIVFATVSSDPHWSSIPSLASLVEQQG